MRAGRAPRGYARPGCARRTGDLAEQRDRRPCRCPAAATAGCSMRAAIPAASARARVALAAVGAEAGGDRVGGRQQQPVGAAAVTVGDDHDRGRVGRVQQRIELRRVERGTVAGDAQHALEPLGERARDAEGDRRALARPRRCPRRRSLQPARAVSATECSRVTTIVRSIEAVSRERGEHVADHRPRQVRRAAGSATLAPRRRLAWAKCLTGRIAAVRICPQTIGGYPEAGLRPGLLLAPGLTSRAASGRRSRRARS